MGAMSFIYMHTKYSGTQNAGFFIVFLVAEQYNAILSSLIFLWWQHGGDDDYCEKIATASVRNFPQRKVCL